jgi:RNA polymerase sigma-54 factor
MDTSQDQFQHLHQTQVQRIAPHLILASEILQCTSVELSQIIERELMENPALDSVEGATADRCAECELPAAVCINSCPFAASRLDFGDPAGIESSTESAADTKTSDDSVDAPASDVVVREDNDYESDNELEYDLAALIAQSDFGDNQSKEDAYDDIYDPLALAPSLPSLRDHLLSRLGSMVSGVTEHRVCEYLVNALDERGWLKIDRVETMLALSITEETLDAVIAALQACDPAGIGAKDLRECLLIQLVQLEEDGGGNPLARKIVGDHWDLLIQRRYDHLVRRTGATRIAVTEAVHFIQTELTPAPARKFREPWTRGSEDSVGAVKPDVVIRRTETDFEVEVLGLDLPTLHINSRYRKLYEALRDQREEHPERAEFRPHAAMSHHGAASRISTQERKHIAHYVERANLFLKNIQQRKKSIERITKCLIETQQGFIETGSRAFLIPMTRTDLARRAGLHESTVSRALLRKFVQLPNQDVVSFDAFFAPAGSIKDMIAGLIATENHNSPLSDEALRLKLGEAGINVARRTIVKYRESLRIPASYLRRSH